jgi:hypothetical protein
MKIQLIRNFAVALIAATTVFAQGSERLVVQVPFGFHVGASTLPSGAYTVSTDAAPGVVKLRSADSKTSVMIIANSVQTLSAPTQGKLIFNKYGDEYFLSQIWKAGNGTGSELRKTRLELETASSARRDRESIMAKN